MSQYNRKTFVRKAWISSDVVPAKAVGITPIYLIRNGAAPDDSIRTIRSLDELSGLFQS